MNKHLSKLFVALLALPMAVACGDDDAPDNGGTIIEPPSFAKGMLVLNAGNAGNKIDGSLHFVGDGTVENNIFQSVNGTSLGGTPNDMIVYGSKTYIVGSDENSIFVLDTNSRRLLQRISTTQLMGDSKGLTPRHLTCGDGKVFVSAYGTASMAAYSYTGNGYVADIDTTTYASSRTVEVGPFPEGMDYYNGTLYVANSDYSRGNGSVSVVSWLSGSVKTITEAQLENPQQVVMAENKLFVVDWGHYTADYSAQEGTGLYAVSLDGSTSKTKVADATYMDVAAYDYQGVRRAVMFLLNAPYGAAGPSYAIYQTVVDSLKPVNGINVESPAIVALDRVSGQMYVASFRMGEYGYADYSGTSYVVIYDHNTWEKATIEATEVGRYDVGNGQVTKLAAVYYE